MRMGWISSHRYKSKEIWMGYFRVLDELEKPGCPLCNRIRKLSGEFLDDLYPEVFQLRIHLVFFGTI